ncbi:MAG: MBL fold metallo-hydrolase, partial [Promethearchaeota archaeon]
MEVIFLGTGPATAIRGKGKNYRTNTSLLVKSNDKNILIDASPMIIEQLFTNAIENIDAILLTHSHHSCVRGLEYCARNFKDLQVFALEQTFEIINKYYPELNIIKNTIKPNEKFDVLGMSVLPVSVNHTESLNKKNQPCVAFKFGNNLYAPNIESIPNESLKYFNKLNNLILNASIYFDKKIKSHLNLDDALKIANTHKPKKTILTQIGRTYPDHYVAKKKIDIYCKDKNFQIEVDMAYDGLVIDSEIKLGKILNEKMSIYLKAPLPEKIFNNEGRYFFRPDKLTKLLKINLYLVDDSFCYGIVELIKIIEIKPKDLERIKKERVDMKEIDIKETFKKYKKLYAYEVKIITKFPRKKSIKIKGNKEDFYNPFEF